MNTTVSQATRFTSTMWGSLRRLGRAGLDSTVAVGEPTHRYVGTTSTVSTHVDGHRLFFSSTDVALKPSMEGIGAALLVPSLHTQRGLHLKSPVCRTWGEGVVGIPSLLESWWSYPSIDLRLQGVDCIAERKTPVALAFSCGVDSFYSLLKHPRGVDAIVSVLGFDVKLRDRKRAIAMTAAVSSIAAEHQVKPIIISTNLRRQPIMRQSPWERTHGGALAAIGHMLSNSYGTFIISASVPKELDSPWGSHWDLDPRFSSDAMSIEHFGEDKFRANKLIEIAADPLVRKHLRVCWEHRSQSTNCGLCEKCVRTMLILDACGQLGHFKTFGNVLRLADSIREIPYTSKLSINGYERIQKIGVSREYQHPLQNLIERSKAHHYEQT